jgi:hypothetical protein
MNINGTAKRLDFARAVTLADKDDMVWQAYRKRRQRVWLQGSEVFSAAVKRAV